jgi:hypothetical protein
LPKTGSRNVIVSVGLSSRTETAIAKEAKRLEISFSDMVRRIMDPWADEWHVRNEPRVPRASMYDHPSSHQPAVRAR